MAACLALPASSAAALTCGQTVTSNVKLSADMDCSGSNTDGLLVGKGGITINLNGHTLTGPGGAAGSYAGIDNSSGYDKITLRNGIVKNYAFDVLFEYTTGSKILGLEAIADGPSYDAISFWYSANGLVKRSKTEGGNSGVYLHENSRVNVVRTRLGGAINGIYDYQSRSTLNRVRATGNSSHGIYLRETYRGYRVLNSVAYGNGSDGIYVHDNVPASLYGATLNGNVADSNGGFGMRADLRIPGIRNHAHANTAGECFHVRCNRNGRKHHSH